MAVAKNGCSKFGFALAKGKIAAMTATIYKARVRAMSKIGLAGERIVTKHIQSQDLGWDPLSEAFLAYKETHGYSIKTYVMTSSFFQAITSWLKDLDTVYIGVEKNVRIGDDVYLEPTAILGRLEKMRPLWQPSLEELRAKIQSIVKSSFAGEPGIERL
jgi:hypothetical protein